MRRKGRGKEFIDNKGCRVAEVSDNRRKRKRKEGGTQPERENENGAEGSRVPIERHGGLAKQKGHRPRNKPET